MPLKYFFQLYEILHLMTAEEDGVSGLYLMTAEEDGVSGHYLKVAV